VHSNSQSEVNLDKMECQESVMFLQQAITLLESTPLDIKVKSRTLLTFLEDCDIGKRTEKDNNGGG
jgi:hypothetical protein